MALPLAYNSNQHPAESVAEVIAALETFTGPLRERLGWDAIGIDLRLGSQLIGECTRDRHAAGLLRAALDRAGAMAYTINAFPLARFQSEVVKDRAYDPDWTRERRCADSIAAIDLACRLCDAETITISTVPGSYKPWGAAANDREVIAAAWGRWAGIAAAYRRDHGRRVILCPEPEPRCTLETTAETIAMWRDELASVGHAAAARELGGDETAARAAIAEHLALCYDTCHLSVEFEDQERAAGELATAGVRPTKVQFSACPRVPGGAANREGVASLRAMHEPRFLHQTALRAGTGPVHLIEDLDRLDEGLAACPEADDIRSHFHIPIDADPDAAGLASTVDDSLRGLAACRAQGAEHIAVETYTWSILADERGAFEGTARELEWLAERL